MHVPNFMRRHRIKLRSAILGVRNMRRIILLMIVGTFGLSGCAAVVAGTAGGLIVDEGMAENDGRFDPLEDTAFGRWAYD